MQEDDSRPGWGLRPDALGRWPPEGVSSEGWRRLEAGTHAMASPEREAIAFRDEGGAVQALASAARVGWEPPPRCEPLPIAPTLPRLDFDASGQTLLGLRFEARAELCGSSALRRAYYHARVRRARELGLRHLVVVVPLEGHREWAQVMGPAAYLQQVQAGALEDHRLALAIGAGLTARTLVDTEEGWVVVMAWENPAR